jgi:hypothetical protein
MKTGLVRHIYTLLQNSSSIDNVDNPKAILVPPNKASTTATILSDIYFSNGI